jgi:RimJ/RimL family protein N-acetyltransferase
MSKRLTLELLTVTHAPELASSLSDAAVYEVIGGSPRSEAEWRNLLRVWERRLSPDGRQTWLNWAIRLLPLGPVVGYVQATVEHGEAQIAYVVGTPWQRKGYAVEAVRDMLTQLRQEYDVHLVRASIAPGHVASERAAAAAGLTPTAEQTSDGEQIWMGVIQDPA